MREPEDLMRHGIGFTSQRTRERLIQRLIEEGIKDQRVLEALRNIPRHMFVDEALSHRAYEDTALPIGNNQTISQPFMVAYMSEVLLEDGPLDKVLEIGTGSGYQTAVLSRLVERVFSVERIKPLQDRAKERLVELNLRNQVFRWGDGFEDGRHWPLQWHHRHRRRTRSAPGLARPAGTGRAHGDTGGRQWRDTAIAVDRARRTGLLAAQTV